MPRLRRIERFRVKSRANCVENNPHKRVRRKNMRNGLKRQAVEIAHGRLDLKPTMMLRNPTREKSGGQT
jgi:hypothetical protein